MTVKENDMLYKESEFDKLLKNKEAEGWHFVGKEGLTQTKFSKDAKFEEVPYQTENSIEDKYLQLARQENPFSVFEVDLVLDENTDKLRKFRAISTEEEYRNIINNLREEDRVYYVFVRKNKNVQPWPVFSQFLTYIKNLNRSSHLLGPLGKTVMWFLPQIPLLCRNSNSKQV